MSQSVLFPLRTLFPEAIYKCDKTGVLVSSISVQQENAW